MLKLDTNLKNGLELTNVATGSGASDLNLDRTTKFVTYGTDAKTVKGQKELNVVTGIQYLAPSTESGVINVCSDSTEGCEISCLFTSGRAEFDPAVNDARIFRTLVFVQAKPEYWTRVVKDIEALRRASTRKKMTPAVRMNGTSDLPYERMKIKGTKYDGLTLMEAFPDVQFYDYTKTIKRLGNTPSNYYLLASYSERMTFSDVESITSKGFNVAVVFRVCEHIGTCKCSLPTDWNGIEVLNGDKSDVRFMDKAGVIVGLKAKGQAKSDTKGFVIQI